MGGWGNGKTGKSKFGWRGISKGFRN